MSARTLRVNESLQRELSGFLRKSYQSEAVAITIAGVDVKADFSEARVFVAVTGDAALAEDRLRWLRERAPELRFALSRLVLLRRSPALVFELDTATARGNRLLGLLDSLAPGKPSGEPPAAP
jgi:ribosome-binding factor A